MNSSRARQSGCLVSVVAAMAMLAIFVYVVASCATFGDTTRDLDADGVRTVVKNWTGAVLPEGIAVVTAQEYASRDSSMYAVFDAPSGGLDGFLRNSANAASVSSLRTVATLRGRSCSVRCRALYAFSTRRRDRGSNEAGAAGSSS